MLPFFAIYIGRYCLEPIIQYLLIKRHKKTGLRYLCKHTTDNVETCFTYTGSGTRWKRHLEKHGREIDTEIIFSSTNPKLFRNLAKFASVRLGVSTSPHWANLCDEEGQGGNTWINKTPEERRILIQHALAKTNTEVSKAKSIATRSRWSKERDIKVREQISKSNRKPKSEQHKLALRGKRPHVNQTGAANNNAKSVYTPDGVFATLTDASKYYGVSITTISRRIVKQAVGWGLV